MLKIKRVSEVIGKRVYTDNGEYFGVTEEVNLGDNKIDGWRIKVDGSVGMALGGAKGVVIPHQYVKSIGDVVLVNKSALPARDELEEAA